MNPRLVGLVVRGVEIRGIEDLEQFIKDNEVQIAALTIPEVESAGNCGSACQSRHQGDLEFCPYRFTGSR